MIKIYTDGASRGNPGPGGFGAIIFGSRVIELGGNVPVSTNNRMELTAVITALTEIEKQKESGDITIYTDSAYVLFGATQWVVAWEKNGWKTKEGEPVLNQDLWQELILRIRRINLRQKIAWEKVAGHKGLLYNDRADQIATSFADSTPPLLFRGVLKDYEKFIEEVMKTYKTPHKGIAYSYVSEVEGVIVVHKTWEECKKRVSGKKGVRYKKVFSKEDEEKLISLWRSAP